MSTQISISPIIKLEVNTTPITGGNAGQVLFQTTSNTVGESANLFWDNPNGRLGIGTSSPSSRLHVIGSVAVTSNLAQGVILNNTLTAGSSSDILVGLDIYPAFSGNASSNWHTLRLWQPLNQYGDNRPYLSWRYGDAGGTQYDVFRMFMDAAWKINFKSTGAAPGFIFTGGNVLIGTTTDAGFRLDVNGTARTQQLHTFLQGTYLDANTSNNYHRVYTGASTYGGLQLQNEIVNYTGYITTGRSGNQLGINFFHTTYAGGVSASSHQKFTQGGVQFGSLSLPNTLTVFNVGGGNGTVNYPIIANNQLNTTNTGVGYLFQTGDITGSGPINHAAISAWKTNGAAPSITSSLRFYTISDAANSLTEKMRIADSGNVLINTTIDSGFRLDVDGSMRGTNGLTLTGGLLKVVGLAGAGTAFTIVDDNGSFIRNSTWNYDRVTLNTWVGGTQQASSVFTLNSTTKGFLPPKMTNAQMLAIATPVSGLMVYDTTNNKLCCYDGTTWQNLF